MIDSLEMFNKKNDGMKPKLDLKGAQADTFLDSIEEEIRNENYQRLWNKYGKAITCISLAVIIGSGIYNVWQKQDKEDREAISNKYTFVQNALMAGDKSALAQMKELSNVSKKDYATLAKFEYAAVLRQTQDKKALDEYKAIYDDKKANVVLKDLAYIFYVSTALDLMSTKMLTSNIEVFIKNLKNKYIGKTWDLLAKETLAFCYIKQGDNEKAKNALLDLAKTHGITESMLERTKILLHSIGA